MPDRPGPYAAILRFMSGNPKFRIAEPDLSSKAKRTDGMRDLSALVPPAVATPEDFAEYDRVASEGERTDPDNAYFPVLRAAGLYANHRDREAVSAILRAGTKTHWNDYAMDDGRAAFQLDEFRGISHFSLTRLSQITKVYFPHIMALYAVARMTVGEAATAEHRGYAAQGIAMRHAQMRYGSLMRSQSDAGISGPLVGEAVINMAMGRLGGEAMVKLNSKRSQEERNSMRKTAYLAYLHRLGHNHEARWVRAELSAGHRLHEILNEALYQDTLRQDAGVLIALIIYAELVLSNVLVLLILGGVAYLTMRYRPEKNLTLPRVALFLVIVLCLYRWQGHVLFPPVQPATFCGYSSDLTSTLYSAGFEEPPWIPRAMVLYDSIDGTYKFSSTWSLLSMFVPGLTVLGLMLASCLLRVPIAGGILRGMRGFAVPLACGLAFTYCCLIIVASVYNNRINARLDGTAHHEGRYLADMVGKSWPGL